MSDDKPKEPAAKKKAAPAASATASSGDLLKQVLDNLKARAGSTLDSLEAKERKILESVLNDLAVLTVRAMAGEDVEDQKRAAEAAVLNLKSSTTTKVTRAAHDAFSSTLQDIVGIGLKILLPVA